MTDGSVPPNRKDSSLEMTAVSPRPPLSTPLLAALDLDPNHPETRALMAQATIDEIKARETMVECEGPCRTCPCCHGAHMVTPARAATYRAAVAKLVLLDEPGDGVAAEPEPFIDHTEPPDDAA